MLRDVTHLRIPEIAAHLFVGFDLFLGIALDLGVVDDSRGQDLRAKAFLSISEACKGQDDRIGSEDPIVRFAEILIELESQKLISLSGHTGDSRTEMIGWEEAAAGNLLLLSEASYRRVAQFCQQAGSFFPLKPAALHKALHDAHLLIPSADGRLVGRAYVPNSGSRVRVLRLLTSKFRALAGFSNQDGTTGTTSKEGEA